MTLRRMYRSALGHVPRPVRGIVASIDYRMASRPAVFHDERLHPRARLRRGAVTISLDFELAWGSLYSRRAGRNFVQFGLREREQMPRILAALDEFHVPATWATVGHLFLEKCTAGSDGRAHHGMPRIMPFENERWIFQEGDWFQFDPCTDVRRDPAWYGPDLIEKVLASKENHELGCHSFSHPSFGQNCPRLVAEAEVEACAQAMAPYGLRPTTWVFPRHEEGNFEALAAKGVGIVRAFPGPASCISLPILRPDHMWGVHVSSAVDRGLDWSFDQRLKRLQGFVDAAAKERLAAHIWLHPSLSDDDINRVFKPFLRHCAARRDEGKIDALTMEQLVTATRDADARKGDSREAIHG